LGETIGGGGNVGRYVGLAVGVPREVPGYTVIRACATGLEAVTQAATAVWAGTGEAFLAGGTESMSQQPWLQPKPADAFPRKPRPTSVRSFCPCTRRAAPSRRRTPAAGTTPRRRS